MIHLLHNLQLSVRVRLSNFCSNNPWSTLSNAPFMSRRQKWAGFPLFRSFWRFAKSLPTWLSADLPFKNPNYSVWMWCVNLVLYLFRYIYSMIFLMVPVTAIGLSMFISAIPMLFPFLFLGMRMSLFVSIKSGFSTRVFRITRSIKVGKVQLCVSVLWYSPPGEARSNATPLEIKSHPKVRVPICFAAIWTSRFVIVIASFFI